jgi:hypothetical protein
MGHCLHEFFTSPAEGKFVFSEESSIRKAVADRGLISEGIWKFEQSG